MSSTRRLRIYGKELSYVFNATCLACGKKHKVNKSFKRELCSSINMDGKSSLLDLKFDNAVLKELPLDSSGSNFTRPVPGACFSLVSPSPVENPKLVAYSPDALNILGLSSNATQDSDFAEHFSGNKLFNGSQTAAHCYCGHQFGNFAGQLGDGAAIYLGEVINKEDQRWELQLKGAGKTPFSRSADGRKVLRSSIREFLCSEAMHSLGIATTRAATCVTSDSKVIRDIHYNGNAIQEKCTIVSRIAPTFIRFGSFEIFKETDELTGRAGPSVGRNDILEKLLDYVIKYFYKDIWERHSGNKVEAYIEFYEEIVRRTACLVAQWMCVGWCHGVLNTDNMSIIGVTIDYGPYGFLDSYDPHFICNTSDDGGRYAFDQQPVVCKWNLMKLAEALSPIVPSERMKTILEEAYDTEYKKMYDKLMRKKFGIIDRIGEGQVDDEDFKVLRESFLETMEKTGADFTNSFRALSTIPLPSDPAFSKKIEEYVTYVLGQCATVDDLRKACVPRMDPRQLNMLIMLMQSQPDLLAQLRGGQKALLNELERRETLQSLEGKTNEQKKTEDKALWEDWLKKYTGVLKKLESSSQSDDIGNIAKERVKVMNETNPRFILRNYIAQQAIEAAESGDFSEVQRVLKRLQDPYDQGSDVDQATASAQTTGATSSDANEASATHVSHVCYDAKPPEWASDLRVT